MVLQSKRLIRPFGLLLLLAGMAVYLQSCAGFAFNFTGGRLPPDKYQRVIIQNFFSDVSEGPANLGINFTERLREYYQRNTPLVLVDDEGHIEFSGSIVTYSVTPVSPSGNQLQQAEVQRLTIAVKVDYIDNVVEKQSFNSNFSFFQDFGADQTLAEVEDGLIEIIFDQIVFDIFNKTYANW